MTVQILYLPPALKAFRGMDSVWERRIRDKVAAYAADPSSQARNVKRLQGSIFLRLRVGDYRAIFTENGVVLAVHKVDHRKDVYR